MELVFAQNLVKSFGAKKALDGFTLRADRGRIIGLLGPNGAGKTTAMRLVSGFLRPDAGEVFLAGKNLQEDRRAALRMLGYLPESMPLYPDMTPWIFLNFAALLRGLGKEAVTKSARLCQIEDKLYDRIETLSKGYKRRVALAQALLHNPEILILDEPMDGLDPNQKHHWRKVLTGIAAEKAIIISTHDLHEACAMCHRLVVIAGGRIARDLSPQELAGGAGAEENFRRLTQEVAAS